MHRDIKPENADRQRGRSRSPTWVARDHLQTSTATQDCSGTCPTCHTSRDVGSSGRAQRRLQRGVVLSSPPGAAAHGETPTRWRTSTSTPTCRAIDFPTAVGYRPTGRARRADTARDGAQRPHDAKVFRAQAGVRSPCGRACRMTRVAADSANAPPRPRDITADVVAFATPATPRARDSGPRPGRTRVTQVVPPTEVCIHRRSPPEHRVRRRPFAKPPSGPRRLGSGSFEHRLTATRTRGDAAAGGGDLLWC